MARVWPTLTITRVTRVRTTVTARARASTVTPLPWFAYLCLAASMSLVGIYVALAKPLAAIFPVFLLAWLRFGIGGLAMPHWLRRAPREPPMTAATKRLVFLESLFGNFLFSLFMLTGVALAGAVSAGVVMASIPAACALLSWLLLKERIAPRTLVAIAMAVGGILLVALFKSPSGAITSRTEGLLGMLLLLGAVFCEAMYAVIGKKLTATLSAKRITALVNAWGFILMTPFGLWVALRFDFTGVSGTAWGLLIFYSLAASVGSVWLWMTGLKRIAASQAGVFTVFLPVATALTGVVALGEAIGSIQLLAYGLALGGVLLATWPDRSAQSLS
jgi:drug/metabolite transporter (DMT)-like permease